MTGGGDAQARARLPARLTVLSRAYCHLCEEMLEDLAPLAAHYRAEVVEIDVDADPALEDAFGDRVPVLLLGPPESGRELCHFRLDPAAVAEALASDAVFR